MLAELDDLVAIGALETDVDDADPRAVRATRLLELISAQVVGYLQYATEAALHASNSWTAERGLAVASVVVEVASERLSQGAAPNVGQGFYERIPTVLLRPYHKRALDEIFGAAGGGSFSIVTPRDEDTSFFATTATETFGFE